MAKQFRIRVNPRDKARVSGKLLAVANGTNRAFARGNNATAAKARTRSGAIITKEIALGPTLIKRNMKVHKGNVKDPTSKVTIPSAGLLVGFFTMRAKKSGLYSVKLMRKGKPTEMPEGTYHKPKLRYSKPPKGSLAVPTGERSRFGFMRGKWLYGPSPSQAFDTKISKDKKFMVEMADIQKTELARAVRSLL